MLKPSVEVKEGRHVKKLALLLVVVAVVGCSRRTKLERTPGRDASIAAPATPTTTQPAVVVSDTIAIAGVAEYEKALVDAATNGLAGARFEPIRFARVSVVDVATGAELEAGHTDSTGQFLIELTASPDASLRVDVWTVVALDGLPFAVVEHPKADAKYQRAHRAHSETFTGSQSALRVVADNDPFSGRPAGAFNVYTQLLLGAGTVIGVEPGVDFPALQVHWEDGVGVADGLPGCTCFAGVISDGRHVIGISDDADNDNAFDDSVILHEMGHYLEVAFEFDPNSPGGPHGGGVALQDLDPRLAFSEGWATAFAQIALGHPIYTDTGAHGFSDDLESPSRVVVGPGSEDAISAMLWTFSTLGVNLTRSWKPKEQHTLVTGGPYRWVRHPFYVISIVYFSGLGLMASNWILVLYLALAVVLIVGRAPREEAHLVEKFWGRLSGLHGEDGAVLTTACIAVNALDPV